MGALATMDNSALAVAPGELVTTSLRVRNGGSVVDEFTFEVIGVDPEWTTVEPEVLRLLPNDEGVVQVTMAPPRASDLPAGDLPFGIKVNSKEDPEGSVVEEGILAVGAFADITAELLPKTSQGSRKGKHELAIDNRGNEFLDAQVSATDPDDLLTFSIAEPAMSLEPGTAAFTDVEARPRKRFWRGPNKTLPFQVAVQNGVPEQEPVLLDGTMVQKSVLPPWLLKALLALLALLLLLWILWLTLLQPTIESRAEEAASEAASDAAEAAVDEAVEGPLAAQSEQVAGLNDAVNTLAEEAGQPTVAPPEPVDATPTPGATGTPTPTATPTPSPSPSPTTTPPPVETNTDVRLATQAGAGGSDTDSFPVSSGETLRVTDIVLQNPSGNVGTLRVLRDNTELLRVALENFRDLDYHFVTPIVVNDGESLNLALDCETVTAPGGGPCSAAALINGVNLSPPEE